MERPLARSALSIVEHRVVPGVDPLPDSVHSGRRGRIWHAGAAGCDPGAGYGDGDIYAARMQAFASSRSAGGNSGKDGGVCGEGGVAIWKRAKAKLIARKGVLRLRSLRSLRSG